MAKLFIMMLNTFFARTMPPNKTAQAEVVAEQDERVESASRRVSAPLFRTRLLGGQATPGKARTMGLPACDLTAKSYWHYHQNFEGFRLTQIASVWFPSRWSGLFPKVHPEDLAVPILLLLAAR